MTLQVDRILRLADRIEGTEYVGRGFGGCDETDDCEDHKDSFTMSWLNYPCGTPACIAGHLTAMAIEEDFAGVIYPPDESPSVDIALYLGIHEEDVSELAVPENDYAHWEYGPPHPAHIPPEMAVIMLRHLAKTGGVFWAVAREDFENAVATPA